MMNSLKFLIFFLTIGLISAREYLDFHIESGSHIIQHPDNSLEVIYPNKTTFTIASEKWTIDTKDLQSSKSSLPQQWLAWYFKSALSGTSNGFTSFSSVFEVPQIPTADSNLAIFNALQASYDPTSYNWILQPVLSVGKWMLGTSKGWTLSSVMCNPTTNKCLFTNPIDTQPGHKILGTITQLSGSLNSYQFEVNITDITAKSPTQTLLFSTSYFAPWAFVSLEHNPEGSIKTCGELPPGSLTFSNNVLEPASVDMWQGSQNEFSCGLSVDTFPMSGDSQLVIKF